MFRVETEWKVNPALLERELQGKALPSFEIREPISGNSTSSTSRVLEIAFTPFSPKEPQDIFATIRKFHEEIRVVERKIGGALELDRMKGLLL